MKFSWQSTSRPNTVKCSGGGEGLLKAEALVICGDVKIVM